VTASGITQGCFSAENGGQCPYHCAAHLFPLQIQVRLFPAANLSHCDITASHGGRDRACPTVLSTCAWAQLLGAFHTRTSDGSNFPGGVGMGGRGERGGRGRRAGGRGGGRGGGRQ